MIQNAIDAISQGGLYALFALGIALIFGIMRLVNFAHGELIMCGAYALVMISGPPLVIRIAASLAVVVVLALAMDRVAFRPARGADASTLLITSFAVSYLLQSLAILTLGATPRSTVVDIPNVELVTIATTAVLVAGLTLFLNRTRLGVEMRAAAEDFPTARLLGVRANRVIAAAFAISGVLAGVAAFLLVARTGTVTATIGLTPVLLGFIAAVLGGMNSLTGAALGGFALGVTGSVLQTALPLELRPYRDAFLFGAVLAFMVIRPQGFVPGRTAVTRV